MRADYCFFCDPSSDTYKWLLHESKNFRVVCDSHPLVEGHLLIIPKEHMSCVGAFPHELLEEFEALYEQFSQFIRQTYGAIGTFEHGVFGQTVFHSHTHLLPFRGEARSVIPEGSAHLRPWKSFNNLAAELHTSGGYLFFSVGRQKWLVDVAMAQPRFFRDRFAKALGRPELADWKAVRSDATIMGQFSSYNANTLQQWRK